MPLIADNLRQFTGTESYTRWSILFRDMVLTDGAKYVAENGGGHGAYWLMDAIASYQRKVRKNPRLADFQIWKLKVTDSAAVLTCQGDSDERPAVKQEIPYTDFDLPEITLYVAPTQFEEDKIVYVILLPSEN